jgi:serine/threonine-protein phosphatase 2B catalytic subunit
MFYHVLSKEEFLEDEQEVQKVKGTEVYELEKKRSSNLSCKDNVLKSKIQFISRMLKMQKILREENENIIKIKAMNNNKLPQGILLEGKDALDCFSEFKQTDMKNEMRPY